MTAKQMNQSHNQSDGLESIDRFILNNQPQFQQYILRFNTRSYTIDYISNKQTWWLWWILWMYL